MPRNIFDVFCRKASLTFIEIDESLNVTEISKKSHMTYPYVQKILKTFEEAELIIQKEKEGRIKKIKLTEKGYIIQKNLREMRNLFLSCGA